MKILFLGDSITDVGRNTNNGSLISIGQGYPLLVDACLSVKYPGEYTFENLGISGNRIVDVYARIKADCWNRKPDLVSILIGVNDVWHEFGGHNGVEADRFYNVYRMLVTDTKRALPESRKMILMEQARPRGHGTPSALRPRSARRLCAGSPGRPVRSSCRSRRCSTRRPRRCPRPTGSATASIPPRRGTGSSRTRG